jgi:putative flippase GtrA
MDFAVLLLLEPSGPPIDALVEGLEAGGLTAIYGIPIGSAVPINGRLPVLLAAQPGKTAAAACGLQAVYTQEHDCRSIVLVDTRRGYLAEDILAFAKAAQTHPDCLVVAERNSQADSSFLARLAGGLSQRLAQFFLGVPLRDLRSGLLAIPCRAVPSLALAGRPAQRQNRAGSEFELDLIMAGKHGGFHIRSHLLLSGAASAGGQAPPVRMMLNSMSLYFVLARYVSTSLLTAVVDNLVFFLCYPWVHNLLVSIYLARLVAILVNYFLLRKVVFYSSDKPTRTFPKYIALVLFSGLVASLLIDFFNAEFHTGVMLGKIIAELLLYLVNFAVLNKLVFVHRQPLD